MKHDDFWDVELGAVKQKDGTYVFRVWAPNCNKVDLKLFSDQAGSCLAMKKDDHGYFSIMLSGITPGAKYLYVLDDKKERPDPVSQFQPDGVHGPSGIIDADDFQWHDTGWNGIELPDIIFYEAHIGTFTPEGTFTGAIQKIPYLKELGITCLEIMPVAQFPGQRNWGYDGVGLYAVQNSYGGPDEFKRLIDISHQNGIAVCLDVVYNHFGPEGNYLHDFGPYFTNKYHTPWGDAVNYDDGESDHVKNFIIKNALYWITEFHIDILRLDAVHGIYDLSATHILMELNDVVKKSAKKLGRQVHLIAESDLNDSRIIRPLTQGGYGLSGQWSDDFHHAVHSALTHENNGYYKDFGTLENIKKAVAHGFVYDGNYSPFRKRRHGNRVNDLPAEKLVVCIQNHDQIGNRAYGDRLSTLIDFEMQKTVAALLLLGPNTPLIFMGQEYGEEAPFQYFIDHTDPGLIQAVQEGRKKEFAGFGWDNIPDPKSEKTFLDSKLTWAIKNDNPSYYLHLLYQELICIRKNYLPGQKIVKIENDEQERRLTFEYGPAQLFIFISFREDDTLFKIPFDLKQRKILLNTQDKRFGGKNLPVSQGADNSNSISGCGAIVGFLYR